MVKNPPPEVPPLVDMYVVDIYPKKLKFSKIWAFALPASISGNYLALLCWLAGMKYTTASQAAILNQMSTIFLFILATVWLKEKMTPQRLAADQV